MLRLWHKPMLIGLFPGECWLRHGDARELVRVATDGNDWPAVTAGIGKLLAAPELSGHRPSHVDVVISDSLASICVMPWQTNLHKQSELNVYAQLCFEQAGQACDDQQAVYAEFRDYGRPGLAYALPAARAAALQAALGEHGLRLRSLLPLSAAAYFRRRKAARVGRHMLMMIEASRVTSLVQDARGTLAFDVEAVTTSIDLATKRQLKRLNATLGAVASVQVLIPSRVPEHALQTVISAELPEARQQFVAAGAWI